MEFTGKIKQVCQPQSGTSKSGKQWQKVEFVVEELGQKPYLQSIVVSALNDRIEELKKVKIGEACRVRFDMNAREYNGRWFNSVNLFQIDPIEQQAQVVGAPAQNVQYGAPQPQPQQNWQQPTQPNDGLPF